MSEQASAGRLCCPDCGAELTIHEAEGREGGSRVCVIQCHAAGCRLCDVPGLGRTKSAAADDLVRLAERYGYVRALAEKLRALAVSLGVDDLDAAEAGADLMDGEAVEDDMAAEMLAAERRSEARS